MAGLGRRGADGRSEIERCIRPYDSAEIFWDNRKGAWVIVKDGKIVTYYRPDGGRDNWLAECANETGPPPP